MTHNEKKSLYESIMKQVAKIVNKRLNEDEFIGPEGDDSYLIAAGLDYIKADEEMSEYFDQANVEAFEATRKVATMCTDGKIIYYSPDFVGRLDDREQAFVILHCCAHIIMSHHAGNIEENIEMDKKVNRYLEERWPEFKGLTNQLNGFI